MKTVKVYQYDVFTTEPTRGNAAGVVLNGDMITTDEMQAIAYEAGYNETAFLMASAHADFQIRFFTPQKEVDVDMRLLQPLLLLNRNNSFRTIKVIL